MTRAVPGVSVTASLRVLLPLPSALHSCIGQPCQLPACRKIDAHQWDREYRMQGSIVLPRKSMA